MLLLLQGWGVAVDAVEFDFGITTVEFQAPQRVTFEPAQQVTFQDRHTVEFDE